MLRLRPSVAPLLQPLRRNLHHVALRGLEHVQPLADQHFFRQPLDAHFPADEARHVFQRLREHIVAPARDDRHGAHAERTQLVHRFGLRGDVDRLVFDAQLGQKLLHLDAARASRPPIDSECFHVLLLACCSAVILHFAARFNKRGYVSCDILRLRCSWS
jgi:hypothetical protein